MVGADVGRDFFDRPVLRVARDLIGCTLLADGVGGTIVETEAYADGDPASHGVRGPTPRTLVMFGPPGRIYVYRSHGIHWCMNLVCEREGVAAAVLVRAIAPEVGIVAMRERRANRPVAELCAGPGRVCAALGIDGSWNGAVVGDRLRVQARAPRTRIVAGPRIGISRAADRPWRFGLADSPFVSRPFRT